MAQKKITRLPSGSKQILDHNQNLVNQGWVSKQNSDIYRMNSDKLLWHKDRLIDWAKKPDEARIVPLHIDMGIATCCNLACHFCYGIVQARSGFQGKKGAMVFMPEDVIFRTFSDADTIGVKSIALIGEGENTLNPALYPALIRSKSLGIELSLATHGAGIKPEHDEILLSSLSWLRINISAATEASYMKVHQRPWFNRVITNTQRLIKLRNKNKILSKNGEPCTIGFQMVLTERNFDDIVPLAKLAVELGLDYLVIKACSDTPNGDLGAPTKEYLSYGDQFSIAESLSTDTTKIIVRWEKLGNMGDKSYSTCHGTNFIIAISGNGNVFPCGHWFDIDKDKYLMGNVNDISFEEIVRSDRFNEAQKSIRCLDLRSCETNCRQHQVNITLDRLYQNKNRLEEIKAENDQNQRPKHVNFI